MMKKCIPTKFGVFVLIYALTQSVSAEVKESLKTNTSLAKSCSFSQLETENAGYPADSLKQQCSDYLIGYIDGMLATKNAFDTQVSSTKDFDSNYSSFEKRAFLTRARGYLKMVEDVNAPIACEFDQTQHAVHINALAGKLGYEGQKREALVSSVKEILGRVNIC
jgi:hypothetical protein